MEEQGWVTCSNRDHISARWGGKKITCYAILPSISLLPPIHPPPQPLKQTHIHGHTHTRPHTYLPTLPPPLTILAFSCHGTSNASILYNVIILGLRGVWYRGQLQIVSYPMDGGRKSVAGGEEGAIIYLFISACGCASQFGVMTNISKI